MKFSQHRLALRSNLVDLLHGALASGGVCRSLSGSLVRGGGLLVDVQAEGDELVDALGVGGGLVDGEAGNEEGGLVEEGSDALDGAVVLAVSLDLSLELLDDGARGRDLEGLLGRHVRAHGGVTEGLSLHDTLHVG